MGVPLVHAAPGQQATSGCLQQNAAAFLKTPCSSYHCCRNKRMAATYVLVLTPVRELAVQVRRSCRCC